MQVERITVKKYSTLVDKSNYDFAIQYAKEFTEPEDTFKIGDVYEIPFGIIKDIQQDLEDGTLTEAGQLEYLLKIKPELKIDKMYLDDFCRGLNYLYSNIVNLLETEMELLGGEVTVEEMQAGINRFNSIGIYLQLRQLANNDITKIDDIKQLSYNKCFIELYTRKQESDFQRELQKVFNNKIKH